MHQLHEPFLQWGKTVAFIGGGFFCAIVFKNRFYNFAGWWVGHKGIDQIRGRTEASGEPIEVVVVAKKEDALLNTKKSSQFFYNTHSRFSFTRFPSGNGFIGNADSISQLCLCKAASFA